ncbi:alpha/beta fold hydrolase [Sphingomonas sp.]|uniref:alpha/beta fold hydrolase n=1 Tax=Sphingomonas sp. TaxID=28214 RepID=UPI001B1AB5C3|nr:alpha/beta fold hydrolase [Sphingomonas sp.]MBO9712804.1 alpha/beta fold hydrolase [Sphingomonas sp.]
MTRLLLALAALLALSLPARAADWPVTEGDYVAKDFRFASGETLPALRLHYRTLGTPHRDASGRIDNAVMVLHGTGGTGAQFLLPQFADELYGPGAPLDIRTTYVILPDGIGHGKSSKPSDGMRMAFPHYDYADMVEAQRRLLVEGLGVTRLKLILGTSMGCMHAFVWGTTHPGFAERLAPFACNPVEIAGRNRMWRKMLIDAIEADPAWNGGNYASPPLAGLRTAFDLSILAGGNPVALQANAPTRAQAEATLARSLGARLAAPDDANDMIYQFDASRTYNPSPLLDRITVPMLWINSADDFINPPELGIAEREVKRMPRARFILIPASAETKGHGTHTWAKFWKADLAALLATK